MPAVPIIIFAAGAVLAAASAKKKKDAADQAAGTALTIADYNNRLDKAEAAQVDVDTQQNVRALREDAARYMSRQTAAFVASGVMANTGSPLAVRAATAGKFELRAQQMWSAAEAKEEYLYSQGQAGKVAGQAQADMYHAEGNAAVLEGATKIVGSAYGAYTGGTFSFGGGAPDAWEAGTGANNLSAGLVR